MANLGAALPGSSAQVGDPGPPEAIGRPPPGSGNVFDVEHPNALGPTRRCQWRFRFVRPGLPAAYLWGMADEVVRTVRSDVPFEDRLCAQEWGELMIRGEKERLRTFMRSVGGMLRSGVTALIKGAAKSIGGSV